MKYDKHLILDDLLAQEGGPRDPLPLRSDEDLANGRLALYSLDSVKAALGIAKVRGGQRHSDVYDVFDGDPSEDQVPRDTEHQTRLAEILDRGERGRWRSAVPPAAGALAGIDDLSRRAPHLDEFTGLVLRNVLAAQTIGLPVAIPPVVLLGPPGAGKTWYLSRLGGILGVPFASYAMSTSSLNEGIQGAHPSWRNAGPGLVARTLLREEAANPLVFVDEFDKAQAHGHNDDPYRAFYGLLDPAGSTHFTDEFLGFEIDASHVLWVLAANDLSGIPAPIMDRLTVIEVPAMTREQGRAVAISIYQESNASRRSYFDPLPPDPVLDELSHLHPRSVRIAVAAAMVSAAAEGRRTLRPSDVVDRRRPVRNPIGFLRFPSGAGQAEKRGPRPPVLRAGDGTSPERET